MERRVTGEIRAEGRQLSGVVMAYGELAPSFRERFAPGAFTLAPAVTFNLDHDPERAIAWAPGGGLALRQDTQTVSMTAAVPPIPAGDRALALVRSGAATGLSVEFQAQEERREGDIRIVERALLVGVGLVRSPAYDGSRVEARRRSGLRLRSRTRLKRPLQCECLDSECGLAIILTEEAGEELARQINSAERAIPAVYKDFSAPLGSARRGTLRAAADADGLNVEIDLPESAAGAATVAASEATGVVVRPLLDHEQGEFMDTPEGRIVTRPHLRALLVGVTDARQGWTDAEIIDDVATEAGAPQARSVIGWL